MTVQTHNVAVGLAHMAVSLLAVIGVFVIPILTGLGTVGLVLAVLCIAALVSGLFAARVIAKRIPARCPRCGGDAFMERIGSYRCSSCEAILQ